MKTFYEQLVKTNKILVPINQNIKNGLIKKSKIMNKEHHTRFQYLLELLLKYDYSDKFLSNIFKLLNIKKKEDRRIVLHNILYQYSKSIELVDEFVMLIIIS